MKREIVACIVEWIVIALVSIGIGRVFQRAFNGPLVYVVSFFGLFCLYYQMMSFVFDYGPSTTLVTGSAAWYIEHFADSYGYGVIFLPYVSLAALACLVASFAFTTAISPIAFTIVRFKRRAKKRNSRGKRSNGSKGSPSKRPVQQKKPQRDDWRYGLSN